MSIAITALLIVRLEARRGEWVTVRDLAEHLAVPDEPVRTHLEALEITDGVELQRTPAGLIQAASIRPAPGARTGGMRPNPHPSGLERPERPPWPSTAPFECEGEPLIPA